VSFSFIAELGAQLRVVPSQPHALDQLGIVQDLVIVRQWFEISRHGQPEIRTPCERFAAASTHE
jgi:hypothetical protein